MLSLTREYRLLLQYGGNPLYHTHAKDLPPVPLAPFEFALLGRLSSLQSLADHGYLLSNIKSVAVKTALKKCQQPPQVSANPSGVISAAAAQRALQTNRVRTPEELEAVARAAANPPWMPEMVDSMIAHPERPCRYIIFEDLLHPNSISRFHVIVKRQAIQPQTAAAAATPASSSPPSSSVKIEDVVMDTAAADKAAEGTVKTETDTATMQPPPMVAAGAAAAAGATTAPAAPVQYRYWIKDMGSLNGLYINGVKVPQQQWNLLQEGARVQFAPQTLNAKRYIAAFQAADAVNVERRRASAPGFSFPLALPAVPTMQLSVKDLHIEYLFTSAMNEVCIQRVASLDNPTPSKRPESEDQDTRPTHHGFFTTHSKVAVAAAAGLNPDCHQNSAALALARQQEADAANKAFYARFASHVLPSTAAASGVAMRDEESNHHQLEPFNSASRKRTRDNEQQQQQQQHGAASAAAAGFDDSASDNAVKRARASVLASSAASAAVDVRRDVSITSAPVAILVSTSSSAPSSSTTASTSAAAATTTNSMTEELACAICSDFMYQCAVLDCGHSFCKSCINTWFRKKKLCPVCRAKHKGQPHSVRTMDNIIALKVKECCTAEEQLERSKKIKRIDAETAERALQKTMRDRERAAREAQRAETRALSLDPQDRIALAQAHARSIANPGSVGGAGAAGAVLLADTEEEDDDHRPAGGDDDDEEEEEEEEYGEDDGFFAHEGGEDDDAEEEEDEVEGNEEVEAYYAFQARAARAAMPMPMAAAAAAAPAFNASAYAAMQRAIDAGRQAAAAAAPVAPAAPAVNLSAYAAMQRAIDAGRQAAAAAPAPAPAAGPPMFAVDAAQRNTSKCRSCQQLINRDLLRLKKGGVYHHLQCFAQRHPRGFLAGRLAGLEGLTPEQRMLAQQLAI